MKNLQTANCKLQTAQAHGAFSLVEMLVVIGIIAILVSASVVGYTKVTANAEKTKCNELIKNVHTAMVQLYNENNGAWPRALISGQSQGLLDQSAAKPLASMLGLRTDSSGNLTGYDRFGIVTPWAQQTIKNRGNNATTSDRVATGGTIQDHILHYAIDTQGEGRIEDAQVGGSTLTVRETAMVWCGGRDGVLEASYERGTRKDDVHSWRPGDVINN